MSSAEKHPSERTDLPADEFMPDMHIPHDTHTLKDALSGPIVLDSFPWVDNQYSSTPLGWQGIANNGYYFPSLRYVRKKIEANTCNMRGVEHVVAAALEECNHAHAQACGYSEASMQALLEDSTVNKPIDETTFEMIQALRRGSTSVTDAGLLLLAYPRLGSLEAGRYTAGFEEDGLVPFEEHIMQNLLEFKRSIDASGVSITLELLAPEEQEVHFKESHADAQLGARIQKHPIVALEKRTLARLTGSLHQDEAPLTLEFVYKKSFISEAHRDLLKAGMSPDILGAVYWRDVRTTKLAHPRQ